MLVTVPSGEELRSSVNVVHHVAEQISCGWEFQGPNISMEFTLIVEANAPLRTNLTSGADDEDKRSSACMSAPGVVIFMERCIMDPRLKHN